MFPLNKYLFHNVIAISSAMPLCLSLHTGTRKREEKHTLMFYRSHPLSKYLFHNVRAIFPAMPFNVQTEKNAFVVCYSQKNRHK